MTRFVSDDNFARVVRLSSLVSIGLIIRHPNGDVLVALRTNARARCAALPAEQ
jgi:hypothetical protein